MLKVHEVKAITPLYNALAGGRRVDLRALKDRDIRPGDKMVYKEVDQETREYTGREYSLTVVKTSPVWPLEFNTAEELKRVCVLGFVPKKVLYPVEDPVVTLKADPGLFRAVWSGAWNIGVRPAREEIFNLKSGDVVAYSWTASTNNRDHKVGRIVSHNDKYNLEELYGNHLPEVLKGGLLLLGLARREMPPEAYYYFNGDR
tara:strand:- start:760 stop:1365 length:606 start_codon:yes stop_codon:yes gene_type:complete